MRIGTRLKPASAKSLFDPAPPLRLMDRATFRVFNRWGGYLRRVVRSSIRKRRAPSRPGQAPSRQTDKLRGSVLYAVDANTRSVVVGPQRMSSLDNETPRLLEEGGRARRRFWLQDENGNFHDPNNVPSWAGRIVRTLYADNAPAVNVDYQPRPYMGPAAEKTNAQLDRFWRDQRL